MTTIAIEHGASRVDEDTGGKATTYRLGRVAGLAALPLLWDGIPLTIFGLPIWYGKYVVAAVIVVAFVAYCAKLLLGHYRMDFWFVMPASLFALCTVVSAISSSVFFPQPVTSWLFALYALLPLLIITLFRQVQATTYETMLSIIAASLFVSILIVVDRFVEIDFLSVYQRLSGFDAEMRRLVLIKNEIAFATMILGAAIMLNFPNQRSFIYLAMFVPIFYTLVIVFEVRLAIGAVLLALATFAVVYLKGRRRIFILFSGVLIGAVLVPMLFDKYIDQLLSRNDFAVEDQSLVWRLLTVEFYRRYFDITGGFGFGVMAGTGDTILAFAQTKAAALYGKSGWGLFLADISLFSALFQFGYMGLLAVLGMEVATIWALLRQARRPGHLGKLTAAVGLLVLFLVFNPWPLNMYTLEWCLVSSGTIWYLASLGSKDKFLARYVAPTRVVADKRQLH